MKAQLKKGGGEFHTSPHFNMAPIASSVRTTTKSVAYATEM